MDDAQPTFASLGSAHDFGETRRTKFHIEIIPDTPAAAYLSTRHFVPRGIYFAEFPRYRGSTLLAGSPTDTIHICLEDHLEYVSNVTYESPMDGVHGTFEMVCVPTGTGREMRVVAHIMLAIRLERCLRPGSVVTFKLRPTGAAVWLRPMRYAYPEDGDTSLIGTEPSPDMRETTVPIPTTAAVVLPPGGYTFTRAKGVDISMLGIYGSMLRAAVPAVGESNIHGDAIRCIEQTGQIPRPGHIGPLFMCGNYVYAHPPIGAFNANEYRHLSQGIWHVFAVELKLSSRPMWEVYDVIEAEVGGMWEYRRTVTPCFRAVATR